MGKQSKKSAKKRTTRRSRRTGKKPGRKISGAEEEASEEVIRQRRLEKLNSTDWENYPDEDLMEAVAAVIEYESSYGVF